ncbi:carbohydrate-binding protein [Mariniflexile sp. AS56]|uniref:carbohydrate-binding protein n=1 Tax=Mariniflexile sp. AS56 TaxID=3063957 RepID=UPI0026ED085D|nr:carbohydrate-binding protein [Mariniflexile sp. AS56]MDO7171626.1 carbohydrate-binding protein [Mariniflexile sp. AS56]
MIKKNTQNHSLNSILNKKACRVVFFLFLMVGSVHAQFVHPGLWHKKSDLDRMKAMVDADVNPYISSFNSLKSDGKSSFSYVVRKDPNDHTLSRENPAHQRNQYEDDALAAYQNALMWYITGDTRHAEKSIEILNAWSKLVNFYGGGTEPLCAGLYGAPLINAAEIIKSTYTGWAASDIQAFKDMLVYPGYSNTTVPQTDIDNDNVTFYWRTYMGDPGRHGNQGLLAWRTVMAIGVFLDNEIIYERALRQIKGLPHRTDDLPYPSGPPIVSNTPSSTSNEYYDEFQLNGRENTIPDYGYDDQIQHYIYDNGQCQESSRDQIHSSLGISTIAEIMEVVWNQGENLYGFLDDRVLLGLEFTTKYNLSYAQSYPDQTSAWEPPVFYQYGTRTGRWKSLKMNPWVGADLTRNSRGEEGIFRPVYEMAAAHFTVREDKSDDALWTLRAREYAIEHNGYEKGTGTDLPGWGGLSFRRPVNCAGDPISGFMGNLPDYQMNELPTTIEAENYDFFSGAAEGRTYHDVSTGNSGTEYRANDDVDLEVCSEGGYNITNIETGEWLTYTVNVPANGIYNMSIRYASANANGTIKFNLGDVDVTSDVVVPFGGANSTGLTDWKDLQVASNLRLSKGVQALRLVFNGASNAFKLNNFTISLVEADPDPINLAPVHGIATQSTTAYGGLPERAIDTNSNGVWSGNSVTHTEHGTTGSNTLKWWQVNLEANYKIETINIFNRTGGTNYSQDLNNFTVEVLNTNGVVVYSEFFASYPNPSITISTAGVIGSIVKISKTSDRGIQLAEVEVYGVDAQVLSTIKQELNQVKIFPNPVTDILTISHGIGADVEIYSVLGKSMLKVKIEHSNQTIDMNHFNSGIYFVKMNKSGVMETKKIIKK